MGKHAVLFYWPVQEEYRNSGSGLVYNVLKVTLFYVLFLSLKPFLILIISSMFAPYVYFPSPPATMVLRSGSLIQSATYKKKSMQAE